VKKCPYCDFAVTEKEPGLERAYVEALAAEARAIGPFAPRTVFVGGGTPTELSATGLERLGEVLRTFDLSRVREFTIEANPGTLAPKKLAILRRLGVDRVSLGAQSFHPKTLETLGRRHRAEDIERSVRLLRDAGFPRVNLDLIFSVPGQTEDDVARDLDAALALGPDHVSTYGLTFEKGTPFDRDRKAGTMVPVRDGLASRQYGRLRRTLRAAGFVHYEVSNFARPGCACAHNRVYWRNGAYWGIGCGAASHVRGERRLNERDARAYVGAVLRGGPPAAVVERERLDLDAKAKETAYLALRTSRGIVRETFVRDLGIDPLVRFHEPFEKLEKLGLVKLGPATVKLTARGVGLADAVARELF
jgi:oxygen-independent coproporphyrinogen-3 oxidase